MAGIETVSNGAEPCLMIYLRAQGGLRESDARARPRTTTTQMRRMTTKIRAIHGPSHGNLARHVPSGLVSDGTARVPPAHQELISKLFTKEDWLLLRT